MCKIFVVLAANLVVSSQGKKEKCVVTLHKPRSKEKAAEKAQVPHILLHNSVLWDWNNPTLRGSSLNQNINNSKSLWEGPESDQVRTSKQLKLLRVTLGQTRQQRWLWEVFWITWKGHSLTYWAAQRLCTVPQVPSFCAHSFWGGLWWWCRCLWAISAPISDPSPQYCKQPRKSSLAYQVLLDGSHTLVGCGLPTCGE